MNAIDEALKIAEDAGTKLLFWWRDDDAVAATPALDRLTALTERYAMPLALAVIPTAIEPSLTPALGDASVLVHGLTHRNHAPIGEKRAEFGAHRPVAALTAEAQEALVMMQKAFAEKLVPVFVPPWNRINPDLAPNLAALGFTGLSLFGERINPDAAPGLAAINTHIDPIDWHGSRSLLAPDILSQQLARAILRRVDGKTAELIGLLSHHLAHDEAIWSFFERLLARLAKAPAVTFSDIRRHVSGGTGVEQQFH